MKLMHRLLPVLIIVALISFVAFNFQTVRRNIVYKLGISGDPSASCCKVSEILKANGNFDDDDASIAIFNNQVIDYPKTSLSAAFSQELAQGNQNSAVLGTTNGSDKWIEVSLAEQKLRAWEGNKVVMEFPISSGLWYPTPKGTFFIWYKVRSIRMRGGSKDLGTYYDLPNVPDDLFFYQGYALHGAYWHNNFGHPMSHGCVNEPLANAAQIFDWAGPNLPAGQNTVLASADNPGTKVVIH